MFKRGTCRKSQHDRTRRIVHTCPEAQLPIRHQLDQLHHGIGFKCGSPFRIDALVMLDQILINLLEVERFDHIGRLDRGQINSRHVVTSNRIPSPI